MTQEDKEDKLYRCTACKLEFYQEEKYPSLRCPLCESIYVELLIKTTNDNFKNKR